MQRTVSNTLNWAGRCLSRNVVPGKAERVVLKRDLNVKELVFCFLDLRESDRHSVGALYWRLEEYRR